MSQVPVNAADADRWKSQYEEIATLAGGLAHEVRNPLSTIRLNLELSNGLAVDAQAGWIRSTAYDESTRSVGFRIGGITAPR